MIRNLCGVEGYRVPLTECSEDGEDSKRRGNEAGRDKEYSDAVVGPLEGCTWTMGAERDKIGWITRDRIMFEDGGFE